MYKNIKTIRGFQYVPRGPLKNTFVYSPLFCWAMEPISFWDVDSPTSASQSHPPNCTKRLKYRKYKTRLEKVQRVYVSRVLFFLDHQTKAICPVVQLWFYVCSRKRRRNSSLVSVKMGKKLLLIIGAGSCGISSSLPWRERRISSNSRTNSSSSLSYLNFCIFSMEINRKKNNFDLPVNDFAHRIRRRLLLVAHRLCCKWPPVDGCNATAGATSKHSHYDHCVTMRQIRSHCSGIAQRWE